VTKRTTTTFSNGVQTGQHPTSNQVYTNVTAVSGQLGRARYAADRDGRQGVQKERLGQRVFSDGTTVSCNACSNNRFVLIRQTKTQTQTVITTDTVQTQNGATVTGTTITYSTNGATFSPRRRAAAAARAPLRPSP